MTKLIVKTRAKASRGANKFLPTLVRDKVASRIFEKDFTLWGEAAEAESAVRLGWVSAAQESLFLLPELTRLRQELVAMGISRVVLCGMGGSSLAPEVIAANSGVNLVVLDSTYPSQIRRVIEQNIQGTVVVVSSKSGSTVETDSQKRAFEKAFTESGIDRTDRIIIVTDPGSPMELKAREDGYRVFLANPSVGGRYSALTAFGVVPSVLAGVDMQAVLGDAVDASQELAMDISTNPALILGSALARTPSITGYKDKLAILNHSTQLIGFGNWLEQLIAESTGKIGAGVLPIVLSPDSPEVSKELDDVLLVAIADKPDDSRSEVTVCGSLGEQLLLWEVATAVASRILGVNPFDQPDVESAKIASRTFLENGIVKKKPLFVDEAIAVSAKNLEVTKDSSLQESIEVWLGSVKAHGYHAIHCYLDRGRDVKAESLRDLVSQVAGRPTTFGWGPRFLHSTGQYHKGGPARGVFLQLIGNEGNDLPVPGRDFGFQELMLAQAAGDANVLAAAGRPVLTLEFTDVRLALEKITALIAGH